MSVSSPCKAFYQQLSQILGKAQSYERLPHLFSIRNSPKMYRELVRSGVQNVLKACNHVMTIQSNWMDLVSQYWSLILVLPQISESQDTHSFILYVMDKSSIDRRKGILSAYILLFQSFLKILQESDSLILPLLFQLVKEFKLLSKSADKLLTQLDISSIEDMNEHDSPWTTECARLLQKALTICLNDRNEIQSKKSGVFFMAFQLFSLYIYLQQHSLCNMVLKALQASELPSIHSIPKAHYILFHYYLGRIHLFEGRYGPSQSAFSSAFKHCLSNHVLKKRHILDYLIPLQLLQGHCPTSYLLNKYSMYNIYEGIVYSIHIGHLSKYKNIIMDNESVFARHGTLILFEKLIPYVYRHLIKRIVNIIREYKISLNWFIIPSLIDMFGSDWSIDHVECVLCQLIDQQLVKGYLSHEKRYLVLSQKDPFPLIKNLAE